MLLSTRIKLESRTFRYVILAVYVPVYVEWSEKIKPEFTLLSVDPLTDSGSRKNQIS